jgi:hypothetical protein
MFLLLHVKIEELVVLVSFDNVVFFLSDYSSSEIDILSLWPLLEASEERLFKVREHVVEKEFFGDGHGMDFLYG